MEHKDGSRRLIPAGRPEQEEEGLEGFLSPAGETGIHADLVRVHLLRQREKRLLLLLFLLLLLLCGAAALLLTWRLQEKKEPDSSSPGINNKHEMSKLKGERALKKPSALLTAPRTRNNEGKFLNWESKVFIAYLQGFNYSDEGLLVLQRGRYRVFLQITWDGDGNNCLVRERNLEASVFVFSESYPSNEPYLTMFDTAPCSWRKSLYTSSLLELDAGSRLNVNATFRHLITRNEHEVFFGAELVEFLPQ